MFPAIFARRALVPYSDATPPKGLVPTPHHLVRDEGVAGSNPATPTKLAADISTSCPVGSEGPKRGPGQLSGQKRRSRLSPLTSAPSLIVIEPTASGRKWIARVGDREVCESTSPFVRSARLLLDEGCSADAVIELWRPSFCAWRPPWLCRADGNGTRVTMYQGLPRGSARRSNNVSARPPFTGGICARSLSSLHS
jgi:hypothetical protein